MTPTLLPHRSHLPHLSHLRRLPPVARALRLPLLAWATLSLAVGLAGCGDDNTLGQSDAQRAFAAAGAVLSSGQASLEQRARASRAASSATATATATATAPWATLANVTVRCPEGGSASFSGTLEDNQTSFSYSTTFNDCTNMGVVITGNLDGAMSYSVSGAAGDSGYVSFSYEGVLSFSGAVNGSCSIDLSYAGSATSVRVEGSVCGHQL